MTSDVPPAEAPEDEARDEEYSVGADAWDTALLCRSEGRWEDTLRVLQVVIDREPENAEAWELIAEAFCRLGDRKRCLWAAARCVQADPYSAPGHLWKVSAYLAFGVKKEALEAANEGVELTHFDPELRLALARAFLAGDFLASADQELRIIDRELPEHPTAMALRGEALKRRGETSQALTWFQAALARDPWCEDAWAGRARMHKEAGLHQMAAECFYYAAQCCPMNPYYRGGFVEAIDEAVEKDGAGAIVMLFRVVLAIGGLFLVTLFLPLLPLAITAVALVTRPVHRVAVWWMLRSRPEHLGVYYRKVKPLEQRAQSAGLNWFWGLIAGVVTVLLGLGAAHEHGYVEPVLRLSFLAGLVAWWAWRRWPPYYRETEVQVFWFPGEARPEGEEPPPPDDTEPSDFTWHELTHGRAAGARRLIRNLLASDPDDVRLLSQFSLASLILNEPTEGLSTALHAREQDEDAHYPTALSWILLAANGREEDVRASAKTYAGEMDPFASALRHYVRVLRFSGANEQAKIPERLVRELAPETPDGKAVAGRDALLKRRPAVAEAAFRGALELEPESAEFTSGSGRALAARGKAAEAWALWQQALRMDPNDAEPLELLKASSRRWVIGAAALLAGAAGLVGWIPTLTGVTRNDWMPWVSILMVAPIAALVVAGQAVVLERISPFLHKEPELEPRPTAWDAIAAAGPVLWLMHALQAWLEIALHPALLGARWQAATIVTIVALYLIDWAWPWIRRRSAFPEL